MADVTELRANHHQHNDNNVTATGGSHHAEPSQRLTKSATTSASASTEPIATTSSTDPASSYQRGSSVSGSSSSKRHHHHHHHRRHSPAHSVSQQQSTSTLGGSSTTDSTGAVSNSHSSTVVDVGAVAGSAALVQVPLVRDTMTFEGRQASRLREMERRIESEMKRKKKEWEREVERMREEFLELYPNDRVWGSEEMLNDPLVSKRSGSTDILDPKKMKTLFMDYPDSGRRYKIRFNVAGCDPKTVRVSTDGDRIVVRATKYVSNNNDDVTGSTSAVSTSGTGGAGSSLTAVEYCRKIQKPKDVDHTKFKAYLTSDSILVVEAPVPPSLNLRKAIQNSPSHSHCGSVHSRSPSASPATGVAPDTPSKEKIGVPIFRDENGRRRLHLVVDLGTTFHPQDITVQVIKENKIQVRAKHEEKTIERLCKSKFYKEYELGEKIETYSLTGGLAVDGRLYVGAYAKGQTETAAGKQSTASGASASGTTAETTGLPSAATGDSGNSGSPLQPCNVLPASSSTTSVSTTSRQ